LFVQAFRFAVEPFFFQQAKSLDSKQTYAYVMKWFVYALSIIYLLTIVIIPYIAPLLIRNKAYFNHPSGMKIVPILLAANLCLGLYYTLSVWYKVSGKTKIGALPAFAGAFITLSLNYYLIPRIGFLGSAYTTLIAYASMVIMGYFLCQKYYPIPYALLPILGSIFIAVGSGYLILSIENTIISFCAKILSFAILIGGIYIYEKFIYVSPIKNENNNQS
jgi:O-antigen/teichoic acid export membrane protein